MRTGNGKVVVLVTCGSAGEARRIARRLVESRLAACVNVLGSPVTSVYRWKGKVETTREVLLIVKTTKARLNAVERAIKSVHSYDVPEILVLPILAGSTEYLGWLEESVADQ